MPDELSPEVIERWTRESRARQGLPEKITDPVVLARIATIAFGPAEPSEPDEG
jgi:hypothetical protein